MMFAHPHALKRVRRPVVTDPYSGEGTVLGPWADATETDLAGCALTPAATSEAVDVDRTILRRTCDLLRPGPWVPGLIEPTDGIRDRFGQLWEVDGALSEAVSPLTGWQAGAVIPLRLVEG